MPKKEHPAFEKEICPLVSYPREPVKCIQDRCALWCPDGCAFILTTLYLMKLVEERGL